VLGPSGWPGGDRINLSDAIVDMIVDYATAATGEPASGIRALIEEHVTPGEIESILKRRLHSRAADDPAAQRLAAMFDSEGSPASTAVELRAYLRTQAPRIIGEAYLDVLRVLEERLAP
jgi:hypothetical protein